MTVITLLTMATDVATFLATAPGLQRTQNPRQLTDGMNTPNTLQVYPESWSQDEASDNQQTTFRGGVKQTLVTMIVDLYGRQRSNLGEDMEQLFTVGDAVNTLLDNITTAPYFGVTYIRAFQFNGQRTIFVYGDPEVRYMGIRWTLSLWVY
jgi:hypothetical protein